MGLNPTRVREFFSFSVWAYFLSRGNPQKVLLGILIGVLQFTTFKPVFIHTGLLGYHRPPCMFKQRFTILLIFWLLTGCSLGVVLIAVDESTCSPEVVGGMAVVAVVGSGGTWAGPVAITNKVHCKLLLIEPAVSIFASASIQFCRKTTLNAFATSFHKHVETKLKGCRKMF